MASNDYHFISDWHVSGTPEECFDIIYEAQSLPRWWPSAFVKAEGATFSDGSEATLLATKGWMPYILHWKVKATSMDRPTDLTNDVEGDFIGRGVWKLTPEAGGTHIRYDWTIRVTKPGVKQLSPFLKPLFGSNHRWAMRKGEESLILEIARRRAATEAARELIAAPPPATRLAKLPLVAGAAIVGLVLHRKRRKKQHAAASELVSE